MFFPPPRVKTCPYCQSSLNDPFCEAQEHYDDFGESLRLSEYRQICGEELRETERLLLDRYTQANDSVFEIGCGLFHRTAAYFVENDLQFYGLDPLAKIVHAGKYAAKTCIGSFPKDFEPTQYPEFSLSLLLGGILNGAICQEFQNEFWKGLEVLGRKSRTIVFDSLIQIQGFDFAFENDEKGQAIHAFESAPPQYFPSQKELNRLCTKHGFQIVETLDDSLPMAKRRLFVLQTRLLL